MPGWSLVSFLPLVNAVNWLRVGLRSGRWGWFVGGSVYLMAQWHFLRAAFPWPPGRLLPPAGWWEGPVNRFLSRDFHSGPLKWFLLSYLLCLVHSLLRRRRALDQMIDGRARPGSRSRIVVAGLVLAVAGAWAMGSHGARSRLPVFVRLAVLPLTFYCLAQALQAAGSSVAKWDVLPPRPSSRSRRRWFRWAGRGIVLLLALAVWWVAVGFAQDLVRDRLARSPAPPDLRWAPLLTRRWVNALALALGGTVGLLAWYHHCQTVYEEYDWFLRRNLASAASDASMEQVMGRISRSVGWVASRDLETRYVPPHAPPPAARQATRPAKASGPQPGPRLPVERWRSAWERGRFLLVEPGPKGIAADVEEVRRRVLDTFKDPANPADPQPVPYGEVVFHHLHPFADWCRSSIPKLVAFAWFLIAIAALWATRKK